MILSPQNLPVYFLRRFHVKIFLLYTLFPSAALILLIRMLLKPHDAIQRVADCLAPCGTPFTAQVGDELMNFADNNDALFYYVDSGQIHYQFMDSDLHLGAIKGPCILGVVGYFYPQRVGRFFVEVDCRGFSIPAKEAVRLLNENNRWEDLVVFMSYLFKRLLEHERQLASGSTYGIICYHLRRLEAEDDEIKSTVSVLHYLSQYTSFSRSIISLIISELKKGGYITVSKGHLVSIQHLPERF